MFVAKLINLFSCKYIFLLILSYILKFTYSQTDNGMTMQFLFDGSVANTGTLSGSSTLTTIGSPTLNSPISAVSGKKSVFFNNPNKGSSMSTNYYTASTTYNAPMTVMLWVRTDLSYYMTILGLHHTDCTGANQVRGAFQLDVFSSGALTIYIGLPNQWLTISTTIQANTWTHIAFSVSSAYLVKLYKNGIYIGQTTGTSNFPVNTFQSLFIGGCGFCTRGFHGYMQDLRMYNRELTVEEILFIYNAFTCVGNTYWNSATNVCIACPIGSNSTGSGCTCVGNTYFNIQSSTCDPYFSDGVIGDAPWGIWRAQSYDAGSPLVLRESRGNGRDITISGSITMNNSSGNGALNHVYSLQGDTSSTMLWPTTFTGDFTICSMTRYTGSSNRQRILTKQTSGGNDWLHGHWQGRRGVAHYNSGWRTPIDPSRGTATDWLVMCGQNSASSSTAPPNNIIADGMCRIYL